MQPKSLAALNLREVLIKILSAIWPLLLIPIIHYGQPFLASWLGAWDAWLVRCWLPACFSIFALILYQQQREGSTIAFVLVNLMAIGFGGLFCWLACQKLFLPFWPKYILHIPYFMKHVDWINMGHATGSLFIGVVLMIRVIQDVISGDKDKKKTTHGSARLATLAEMKRVNQNTGLAIGYLPKFPLEADAEDLAESLKDQKGSSILRLNPTHTVIVAPSGSGKGVGIVIPTLLEYEGPVVVTDVKDAENFHVTARYRRSLGRKVYVFDPAHKTDKESHAINILDFLDPEAKDLVETVNMIAGFLSPLPQDNASNSRYFAQQSASLIAALILYVVCSPNVPPERKNLAYVYDLLCLKPQEMADFIELRSQETDIAHGSMARMLASLMSTKDEEFSGIFNTARMELRFLDSPTFRELTSTTTISLESLFKNKADLFLCVPAELLDTHGRMVRLILSMIFKLLQNLTPKPSPALLFVLDEMPLIGNMPQIEKILMAGRAYGVKILAITQTLELLRSAYPKSWETFLANELVVFFGSKDLKACEYVSRMIGQMTVQTRSKNTSESAQKTGGRYSSESEGESEGEAGRALLTPDEVRRLGTEGIIAFFQEHRPFLLKKIKYYEEKTWQGRWDQNPLEEGKGKKWR